ncbi:TK C-terminal domain-like protein [Suillus weaverae]|nr:TK C-terminal domain-like protein [Suillus weaverae]
MRPGNIQRCNGRGDIHAWVGNTIHSGRSISMKTPQSVSTRSCRRSRTRLQYPIDRAKYYKLWTSFGIGLTSRTAYCNCRNSVRDPVRRTSSVVNKSFTSRLTFNLARERSCRVSLPFRWTLLYWWADHRPCPCTVGHGGLYHSQSPEEFFMGASGLKVVIPRSPIQCKGLLLSAIRDPDPVIFMEPKALYRSAVEQVPIDDFALALSRAEILIPGSDLTLLTWGTPVYHCESALRLLNSPPPSLAPLIPPSLCSAKFELIDLRTILPWDIETVIESVRRTKRLMIVHEAGMTGGVGGEIAAEVGKRAFLRLEAPVRRITGWDVPTGPQFEKFNMPDVVRILDGILETLSH